MVAPIINNNVPQRTGVSNISGNTGDSSRSSRGIAIGGAVGGVAMLVAIGLFVFIRQQQNQSGKNNNNNSYNDNEHKEGDVSMYNHPLYFESYTEDDSTVSPQRSPQETSSISTS